MPLSPYANDGQFASYLLLALGPAVVGDLGITNFDVEVVVQDAVLDYGVADIAAATDLKKIRALGKMRTWEWVATQYAVQYRLATDGQTLDRQQKWDHAKAMLALAQADVAKIVAEEVDVAEAEGGFDFAEMVLDPFGAREQLRNESLRGG